MPASLRAHLARSNTRPYDRRSPVPSSPALSDSQFQPQLSPRPDMDTPSSPIASPPAPGPAPPPSIADHPGMPTYAQYKRIEANYKSGLSPRKRDKALITQAMFDKIWDVLHQPDACSIETPQFRFWVRKMFTLGRPAPDWRSERDEDGSKSEDDDDDFGGVGEEMKMEMEMPTAVVLHENRPVAVMEQLYELFCYCHERSGHGGRDKTCAVIRQHYSWVPKELTAQFVKACPTCTLKRSGNPDIIALVQEKMTTTPKRASASGRGRKGTINGEVVEDKEVGTVPSSPGWPTTGGPLDPANPEPCGAQERARERNARGENVGGSSGQELHIVHHLTAHSPIDLSDSGILPILRESPLANLAQEGWALRGASSPLAHVPGSKLHDTGGRSEFKVANALQPQGHSGENSKAVDGQRKPVDTRMKLPSLTSALSNGSLDDKLNLTGLGTEHLDDAEALPPVLRQLQISEPVNHQLPSYLFQIDPVLLAFNYPGSGTAAIPASGIEPRLAAFGISDNDGLDLGIGTPSGIVRNATCSDTLRNLEGTSDERIPSLPFWTELPSTLSDGPFSLSGLSGSPLRNAPDRDMTLSMDFEMHGLPEMMDSPDRSTSSASSSDSPDSSFEYSGPPWSGTGGSVLPFSFSSPVSGCGSRYEYGAPPFLLASPTDEVGRGLSGTLSFPLITDDA